MGRLLLFGLWCVALAGCSRAPDAGSAATQAAGVAFQYSYDFRLPSARIAAAQEHHAQACERLGPGHCRITGMTFNVDGAGEVRASLGLKLAAPIARAFARDGVAVIEDAGGALAAAEIVGTDTADATAQADAAHGGATTEIARLDRQLARGDLATAERAELNRQRAAAVEQAQAGATAATDARASVASTPVQFAYRAGRGVGFVASLADAGQTAYASTVTTVAVVLTALATLGPPAILLLGLLLFWLRWGRRWWGTLAGEPAG